MQMARYSTNGTSNPPVQLEFSRANILLFVERESPADAQKALHRARPIVQSLRTRAPDSALTLERTRESHTRRAARPRRFGKIDTRPFPAAPAVPESPVRRRALRNGKRRGRRVFQRIAEIESGWIASINEMRGPRRTGATFAFAAGP